MSLRLLSLQTAPAPGALRQAHVPWRAAQASTQPREVASHAEASSSPACAAAGQQGRVGAGRRSVTCRGVSKTSVPIPYRWSWEEDTSPLAAVELDASALASSSSLADVTAQLQAAAAAAPPRSALTPSARSAANAAVQRLLGSPPTCSVADAAALLEAYGPLSSTSAEASTSDGDGTSSGGSGSAAPPLACSLLASVCGGSGSGGSAVETASARDLAALLWAVSELDETLPWDQRPGQAGAEVAGAEASTSAAAAAAPAALQRALLARVRAQDFLAPDLCRAVCAVGNLAVASRSDAPPPPAAPSGPASSSSPSAAPASPSAAGFQPDADLVKALDEEIRFQLVEFGSDFEAPDVGRLISGMAGLRLGGHVARDDEYRRVLMKVVYGKTRSLVDKAAVDFALSRLLDDDPEARSMHYDTRWTHEELHWLPRRERDKRRIIKEGWYRTQWGGWSPGRSNMASFFSSLWRGCLSLFNSKESSGQGGKAVKPLHQASSASQKSSQRVLLSQTSDDVVLSPSQPSSQPSTLSNDSLPSPSPITTEDPSPAPIALTPISSHQAARPASLGDEHVLSPVDLNQASASGSPPVSELATPGPSFPTTPPEAPTPTPLLKPHGSRIEACSPAPLPFLTPAPPPSERPALRPRNFADHPVPAPPAGSTPAPAETPSPALAGVLTPADAAQQGSFRRYVVDGGKVVGIQNTMRRYQEARPIKVFETPFERRVMREMENEELLEHDGAPVGQH
ncbi:hypothetical protein HYH03_011841 [Edaphochlamys debaryana]|uniref:Uncharacterized protein n=1 Tax=Edaphochlamys debaryana TaxID=47281 RepID=A0A835XU07_9CHLO|nr:hypothetical protein HYH03_011841 [Edaphochlamys debaryana]|eukprot:KAG2489734.1 hypothetical protein HYH03_011841 [Edaphochlamys debaryana]